MRSSDTAQESCLSCRFWAGVGAAPADKTLSGQCRKHTPTAGVGAVAVWPKTAATDWCAEYQVGATPNEATRLL